MTAVPDPDEREALKRLDDVLNADQRRLLVAMAEAPPDPVDPTHLFLHQGTRQLLMAHDVLDDDGYLSPFGVRAGLSFADDDCLADDLDAQAVLLGAPAPDDDDAIVITVTGRDAMAVRTVAESITHAPAFSARGAIGVNGPIAAGTAWAPLVPVGPVSIDRCSFERNGHRVTLVASTGEQHQVAGSRPAAAEAAASSQPEVIHP